MAEKFSYEITKFFQKFEELQKKNRESNGALTGVIDGFLGAAGFLHLAAQRVIHFDSLDGDGSSRDGNDPYLDLIAEDYRNAMLASYGAFKAEVQINSLPFWAIFKKRKLRTQKWQCTKEKERHINDATRLMRAWLRAKGICNIDPT